VTIFSDQVVVIPPFLTSVKTRELLGYSSCRGGTRQSPSVDEYCYRSIATGLPIHTVRSLANSIAKDAECHPDQIKQANAHKSLDTQLIYQEGHNLPFETVQIQFTAEQIGGDFK